MQLKFGILKDLHDAGLRGRLPLFIVGFLCGTKFQGRVGGSYSKLSEQQMGPDSSLRYRRYINHLLTYLLTYLKEAFYLLLCFVWKLTQ